MDNNTRRIRCGRYTIYRLLLLLLQMLQHVGYQRAALCDHMITMQCTHYYYCSCTRNERSLVVCQLVYLCSGWFQFSTHTTRTLVHRDCCCQHSERISCSHPMHGSPVYFTRILIMSRRINKSKNYNRLLKPTVDTRRADRVCHDLSRWNDTTVCIG